jgi:uncharacterized membrane protein YidH (DUF202 family)
MKINEKIYPLSVIIFSIVSFAMVVLFFLNFIGIDIVMLSLGITQLFSGINQLNLAHQQVGSKGINKTYKALGVFCIIFGLALIVVVLIKMIL